MTNYKQEDSLIKELMYHVLLQAAKDCREGKSISEDYYKGNKLRTQKEALRWVQTDTCMMYCIVLKVDYNRYLEMLNVKLKNGKGTRLNDYRRIIF